jgi:FixJ family two-component response regulator
MYSFARIRQLAYWYVGARSRCCRLLSTEPMAVQLQDSPIIAIVDDDPSVRTAMKSLMMSLGYRAQTFASAQAFLQSPRMGDTACLISDVQMPGMGGLEMQSALIGLGHHVPIIFITAFSDDAARERALKAGAVCVLQKPFDGDSLIRCLEAALKPGGGASGDG